MGDQVSGRDRERFSEWRGLLTASENGAHQHHGQTQENSLSAAEETDLNSGLKGAKACLRAESYQQSHLRGTREPQ